MKSFPQLQQLLIQVLHLNMQEDELTEGTILLGGIPELDSMAVVHLITALEESFNIEIDDEEINGKTFETIGSLAEFIDSKWQ